MSAEGTYGTWEEVAEDAVMGTDYTWYDSDNIQIHTAAGLAYFAEQVNSRNAETEPETDVPATGDNSNAPRQ